ncbi:hypothetical protein IWW55_003847 [Coemansia sp. RSA 2706]|nr:hypothetical protein IWW55_003847 [Coemansia sp. RSA 2706]KAJ2326499.1 hypothetical protein IWW51_002243 [Coemansia sp. RSA 2702]KAJ2362103.1 hypothetical protein H4S01_004948 [Coemansia sp. RSA 2610]
MPADMEVDRAPATDINTSPTGPSPNPTTPTFKTTVSHQPFYYFAITLAASAPAPAIDAAQYHAYIALVLRQWLGAVGGAVPVDVLHYAYPQATVRVPFDRRQAVWQAVTVTPFRLLGSDATASFRVLRASAFAMGVAAGSRTTQAALLTQ